MRIALISLKSDAGLPELALALQRAEMEVLHFSEKTEINDLVNADGYILANIGAASASCLLTLKEQVAKGKPLLGIGDGAVFLAKTGLVPGLADNRVALDLGQNESSSAVLEVKLRLSQDYQYNAFTRYLTPHHILSTSISTALGRFIIPPGILQEIESQGLNVFYYCTAKGEILADPAVNPTGSTKNIAAIANKAGNVMAMVPHPEKTLEGDAIFLSMRDHIASGYVAELAPLDYWPRGLAPANFNEKS